MMTMKNEELQILIAAYLDDELDAAKRAEVEALIDSNQKYKDLFSEYQKIDTFTAEAVKYDPGEEYWDTFALRLQQRMEKQAQAEKHESVPVFSRIMGWFRLPAIRVLATVTPIVVLAFIGVLLYQHQPQEGLQQQLKNSFSAKSQERASENFVGNEDESEFAPTNKSDEAEPLSAGITPKAEEKMNEITRESALSAGAASAGLAETALPEPTWKSSEQSDDKPAGSSGPRANLESNAIAKNIADEMNGNRAESAEGNRTTGEKYNYAAAPYIKEEIGSAQAPAAIQKAKPKPAETESDYADASDQSTTGVTLRKYLDEPEKTSGKGNYSVSTDPLKGFDLRNGLSTKPTTKDDQKKLTISRQLLDQVIIVKEKFFSGKFNGQFADGTYSKSQAARYGQLPVLTNDPVFKGLVFKNDSIVFFELSLDNLLDVDVNQSVKLTSEGDLREINQTINKEAVKQIAEEYIVFNGEELFNAANSIKNLDRVEMFPLAEKKTEQKWQYYDYFVSTDMNYVWVRYHSKQLPSSNFTRLGSHYAGDYAAAWLKINTNTNIVENVYLSRVSVVVWE